MKKLLRTKVVSIVFVVTAVLACTSLAVAQSSGNLSAGITNVACTLNTTTGALTPGCPASGSPANGDVCYSLNAPIKVSNGNGLALVVTPSMVTGLFTSTKINSQLTSSSADIGIQVCLTATTPTGGAASGVKIYPFDALTGTSCVVYDQRFQQISSGLFSQISNCVPTVTATVCTTNADCASLGSSTVTAFCNNPSGAQDGGVCETFPTACNFELILSTLSAHSFNFIVTLPGGSYNINATWSLIGVSTTANSNVAACVGPGTLTVVQGKVFNNSGSITVQ
jgi:hypothetical protein